MYDEEFYENPGEFEQQIDEFKQSLLKVVKSDFLSKMERLEKENIELQSVKKNFDQIKREYRDKERKLEIDREQMKRDIRSERISVLLKDYEVIMFKADVEHKKLPKCDKCDEKRRITYLTPLGKEAHEDCECSKTTKHYVPGEHIRTEFKMSRWGGKEELTVWYKPYDGEDGFSSGHVPKDIYQNGTKFEDIEFHYWTYFRSEEKCQEYCDWLNEREGSEE